MAFQPSDAKLRMFLGADADLWTEAGGAARYGPSAGYSNLGLTPTVGRVSVAGNIAGFGSEPETLPGAITTGPLPFQHPLRSSLWEGALLASLLGAHDTPTQDGATTAYTTLFDSAQTDVSWADRAYWLYFDKTGDLRERWGPCKTMSWAGSVASNAVVTSLWGVNGLQLSHYDGIFSIDTGTPTTVPVVRGWLDAAGDDLVAAEKQLNLKVTGAPTGAGTALDPKVITFTADLGSTPSYGANTFAVTCGTDAEGNPRWSRVLDSTSGDELGAGTTGVPLEVAILDVAGTGYADLDVVSTVLIPAWTPSLTTEPTLLSVHTCVTIDGTEVGTPETFTWTITNDNIIVPGGFCQAMPNQFANEGNITGEFGFTRKWVTDRHQNAIRQGAKVAAVVTIDSRTLIDSGNSALTNKMIISAPNLRPSDGSTLKSFPGGAADSSETQAYRAHPDSSIGDASVRVTMVNTVSNYEA